MIYLLTNTGGRYAAMRLLEQYVNEQTYSGPATWVIVDDCEPITPAPRSKYQVEMIKPDWTWQPGDNTQARSLLAGLERIPAGAPVIVFEDDDCYAPDHIELMLEGLEVADLVGQAWSLYYNVASGRYDEKRLAGHSSLSSSAFNGPELLMAACRASKWIDIELWRQHKGRLLDIRTVVGIKGLPGRPGIGVGHNPNFGRLDTSGILNKWIGGRSDLYSQYLKRR